jgi:hypothetical protein
MSKTESQFDVKPQKKQSRVDESYDDDDYYGEPQPKRGQTQRMDEIYNENDEKEMNFDNYSPSMKNDVYDYTEEQVRNSKLPDSVKKIMTEYKIPKLAGPEAATRFSAEDLAKASGMQLKGGSTNQTRKQSGDLMTVSKSDLNEMVERLVEKKLLEYFTKGYNKLVTQETVKSTISTLIKEGKLPSNNKKKTI